MKALLHGIPSQEVEDKEHGAKVERDMWQGVSNPKVALCRNMAVVEGVAADGRHVGPLIGAGERRLGVSVCQRREQGQTA